MTLAPTETSATRLEITGVVQGVGFRPFVHRLATELGLTGRVGNDAGGVFVEAAGPVAALDALAGRLISDAPAHAHIDHIDRMSLPMLPGDEFTIVESRTSEGARTPIPPDIAVCDDCLAELFDPADRRYRHPFITCTNCGPRFTIIADLPYDRARTTMADFAMCPACEDEYRDPTDRRYHAQPISCHHCGPRLVFRSGDERLSGEGAIGAARGDLAAGLVVAIKGLGGFHLAVDATDDRAVATVRRHKARPDKPLAVMIRDLDQACEVAEIDSIEAELLTSPARPVVLVRARTDSPLAPLVAPGNPLVGVFLPYTPVHHLLLEGDGGPLVMTSANRGGEPITYRDDELDHRVVPLSDAVLTHDRPIAGPCDDSVVRVIDGAVLPIRRARGYAPVPVPVSAAPRSVLAVGAELKNTLCLSSPDQAWVSPHLGDMTTRATVDAFEASAGRLSELAGIVPDVVAVDAHPGYGTTRWARRHHQHQLEQVQHHHAHVASAMAEHQLDPCRPVLGFAFDGTGYGPDGAVWGGEVLVADATGFDRAAHLAYVPLPGGDAAIANPYRMALAHLHAAGIAWTDDLAPVGRLDDVERRVLRRQLDRGVACVPTSSMGRLFDAVASILGLRHVISYEAQAAIDLEMVADIGTDTDDRHHFTVIDDVIEPGPVLRAIVADLASGRAPGPIAGLFHRAVADVVVSLAGRLTTEHDVDTVVLSGGVFQNAVLTHLCLDGLRTLGLRVLTHRVVPPNDGGLALGQAYVAAHRRPVGRGE